MPERNVPSSDIIVNIFTRCRLVALKKNRIADLVKKTASLFNLRKAQINIEVADDKKIIAVKKKFLKKNSVTDVISFDVSEGSEKIFDIIVNAELAKKQAKTRGHSAEAELALYILHGLLHQLGFDDMTARKSAKMHKTEDDILRKSGFGVVYGDQ